MSNNIKLTKKQVEEFQERLEGWLAELNMAANQMTREGRELVGESTLDVADRALNSTTRELLFRQAHERHRLLRRVEAALRRVRDGSFGKCLTCGALIGIKRLDAIPWTEHCVACQEKCERGEISEAGLPRNAPPARIERTMGVRLEHEERDLALG
jgi:RNA polymerase-binding transcription factor